MAKLFYVVNNVINVILNTFIIMSKEKSMTFEAVLSCKISKIFSGDFVIKCPAKCLLTAQKLLILRTLLTTKSRFRSFPWHKQSLFHWALLNSRCESTKFCGVCCKIEVWQCVMWICKLFISFEDSHFSHHIMHER